MASKKTPTSGVKKRPRPATTPEARENQLISMAYDLVEQRMADGTATAQEVTQLMKLGSEKNRLEMEKLKQENELLIAKKEAIESNKKIEELYENAIAAMRTYSGSTEE